MEVGQKPGFMQREDGFDRLDLQDHDVAAAEFDSVIDHRQSDLAGMGDRRLGQFMGEAAFVDALQQAGPSARWTRIARSMMRQIRS